MTHGWRTTLALAGVSTLFASSAVSQELTPSQLDQTSATPFVTRNPGAWRVVPDPVTHQPEFVYGSRVRLSNPPKDLGDFEFAARTVVDDNPEFFGVSSSDLRLIDVKQLLLSRVGSSDKVAVVFQQESDGLVAYNGTITILFERNSGDVIALETEAIPFADTVSLAPAASTDDVLPNAQAAYTAMFGVAPAQIDAIDGVIVGPSAFFGAKSPLSNMGPTLAYMIDFSTPGFIGDHGAPAAGRVIVSAEGDHTVFKTLALTHAIDGKAETNVNTSFEPNTSSNQEVAPLKFVYVRSGSQSGTILATSDVSGDYTIAQTGPTTLVVEYEGPFCRANDSSGADHFISIPNATGSNVDFLLNPTLGEFDTAEAAAFYFVNEFRLYIKSVNPFDNTMDFKVQANVNMNDLLCNAYFDGGSINLERAGSGCTNTSYMDVIQHEEGHFANQQYINGGLSGAFHEGNADNFAYYINDDPCLTSFGGGTCLRNANQTSVFKCPNDGDEGCNGGASHTEGQALASAVWEVREELNLTHGDAFGDAIADALFLSWMNGFNDGSILNVIRDHWLALDDDNADLSDSTPNFVDIEAGFVAYGWDAFPDVQVSIVSAPTTNQEVANLQPVTIVAKIISLFGASVNGNVRFATNGGSFASIAMAPTGNPDEFAATISGVNSPDSVRWYVDAASLAGGSSTFPANVPEAPEIYHAGKFVILDEWDFDSTSTLGWTHVNLGGSSTGDQFEKGNPAGSNEATDPDTAFTGTSVWGTDLSLTGFDGRYEPSGSGELRSPVVNLGGTSQVFLQFRRWLAVEEAIFDQAQIRVNGSVVYQNPNNGHTLDTEWGLINLDISPQAAGNASSQITFRLTSDGGLEFGGWNLDDVILYRVDPAPTAFFAPYGAGCAGGSGNLPTLAGSGVPTPGGSPVTLLVTNGKPSSAGLLLAATQMASQSFGGNCSLLVGGTIVGGGFPVALDGSGSFSASAPLPGTTAPADIYWQFLGDDAGGVGIVASASNGLQMHIQ